MNGKTISKQSYRKSTARQICLSAAAFVVLAMTSAGARAQDITTTTIKHGSASYDTRVKNAEVVYVEGNDLVLKLENDKIEHLIVPDSDKFTIDGNDVTMHELMPGTKLTQTITTSTAPRYVTSVRVLQGKVWHVNPPYTVVLKMPSGPNQTYTVPKDAKFTIGGKAKTVFDLRKGMKLTATIVTDDTHTVVQETKTVVAQLPEAAMPQELGVLLIFHPTVVPPPPPAVLLASLEEPAAATLPKTGSLVPLTGLLGALAISLSLGLGAARRSLVKI